MPLARQAIAGRVERRLSDLHLARFKTPEQGAATATWRTTAPALEGLGGVYREDCDIAAPADGGEESAGVEASAIDRDAAARLWSVSAALTGVDAFAMA